MNEFVNKKAVEQQLDRTKVVKNITSPSTMQAKALDKGHFDTKITHIGNKLHTKHINLVA